MTAIKSTLPSIQRLREVISYDPETGVMTWLVKSSSRVQAGQRISRTGPDGYIKVGIDKAKLQAHRVAWAIHHGQWPEHQIDHINGIRTDNRMVNLRDIEGKHNSQNMRSPMSTNSSGFLGVSFQKRSKKRPWTAFISIDHKTIYIGCFASKEEAHAAYVSKKRELHPASTL